MAETYIATAETTIDASPDEVWDALTTPDLVEQYFFGATVASTWEVGSPIVFRGEWEGEPYEDKGEIVAFEPPRRLVYTHWSPLSGEPDVPETYHTVAYDLVPADEGTTVTLTQDNNQTEAARDHATENWTAMLASLKALLE